MRPGAGAVAAAAFDTRIKGPGLLWGSAAKPAARQLQAAGFRLIEEQRLPRGGVAITIGQKSAEAL